MKVYILYRRVSTVRQATEGESLDAQHARLQAWVAQQGEDARIIGDYVDAGLSGADAQRPGMQAAMTQACRAKATILVTGLSRWGRSPVQVIESCNKLTKAGASLVSLAEAFDLRTSTGRLLLAVLSAVNCWQMEVQQEATVQTLAHMRVAGRRISGHSPYGWDFDEIGHSLIEKHSEQLILGRMQALRAAGRSFQYITTTLNDDLVPAKLGGRWSARAVRLILGRLAKLTAA